MARRTWACGTAVSGVRGRCIQYTRCLPFPLTLRTAYYQVAHSRERPLRGLFNLLCYFRSCSEGRLFCGTGSPALITVVRWKLNTFSTTGRRSEVRMPCAAFGTKSDWDDIPASRKVRTCHRSAAVPQLTSTLQYGLLLLLTSSSSLRVVGRVVTERTLTGRLETYKTRSVR